MADDEGLISVINPKNENDDLYVKKSDVVINPNALKPSKEDTKKKKEDKKEDNPLAGLGL